MSEVDLPHNKPQRLAVVQSPTSSAVLLRTGNALKVMSKGTGCLQACRFAEVQGVVHAITATAQEQLQRHDAWQSNAPFARQAPSGSSPSICNGAMVPAHSCGHAGVSRVVGQQQGLGTMTACARCTAGRSATGSRGCSRRRRG
jgi:hypothetical protein